MEQKCACKCNHKGWRATLHVVLGIGLVAAIGAIVMGLWNWLMPDVTGWSAVNYCQALGLFVLGRMLVGGLKFAGCKCKCRCGCHDHKGRRFREKWEQMSPEERKEFMDKCDCGCEDR